MTDALLFWVSQWAGVTVPLIITLVCGLAVCTAVVTALWTRRIRMLPALLVFFAGSFLVLISLDTRILHGLVSSSYLVRVRLIMGLLSLLVMGVTFEAVRRSRLKERYAILWMFTGFVILLCAVFPAILDFLTALLGMQYITAVGVVMFIFFLLVLFHVSLALSNIQEDETATSQRCAQLEARIDQLSADLRALRGGTGRQAAPELEPLIIADQAGRPDQPQSGRRSVRGFVVGVPLLITATALAVLWTGLRVPQAMVGDEVTHYYMLIHQAEVLPDVTFQAPIPTGWGEDEIRSYPHANLWHYAGACLYNAMQSFAAVQVYQMLFLVQLLIACFLLMRDRRATTPAIMLYLLMIASLPVTLIFSVAFYQDVPVTAQLVTAFLLLTRRRWLGAVGFMMLAVSIKETAVLFVPVFFVYLLIQRMCSLRPGFRAVKRAAHVAVPVAVCGLLIFGSMAVSARLIRSHSGGVYYPFDQMRTVMEKVADMLPGSPGHAEEVPAAGKKAKAPSVSRYEAEIIANHPGDLRRFSNWFIYFGILIWLIAGMGLARLLSGWKHPDNWRGGLAAQWPLWVGLSYILPASILLKTAPDARFFMPAIPFVLLPFVESFARLPRQRMWMSLWVALAIAQGGFVLAKTVQLRQVSPELKQAISYLTKNPPPNNRVFMYPEGNYRLFPVEHDWYLKYRLREFWRGDNDFRLQLLAKNKIGAIVVKKHLVGPVDGDIKDLGVYPDYFVKQISEDPRFRRVFNNPSVVIYEFDAPVAAPSE